jgi:hypothetical protein
VGKVGERRAKREGERGQIWWKLFVFMYENRATQSVGIVLRRDEGR